MRGAFLASVLGALLGAGISTHVVVAPQHQQPALPVGSVKTSTKRKRVLVGPFGGLVMIGTRYSRGTVAQAKRAAIKTKNRAMYRRACK